MVNRMGYIFEKPKRVRKPRPRNFVAFDTETRSDGSFICGAYFGYTTTRKGRDIEISDYYENIEDFQEGLFKIEKMFKSNRQVPTFVGFNTAYDLAYLLPCINTNERLDVGSRFISCKTLNNNDILDVANHVFGSLDSWINRLNMEEEYGICKREGYLNSEEGKKAQVLDDAAATYFLANWVQDQLITRFNTPFKPTRYGVALEIFRRNYFTGRWRRTSSEQWKHDFERQGYYGGRCEIFRRGLLEVSSYDVNSMYVAIMCDCDIPNPSKTHHLKDEHEILSLLQDNEHLMIDCDVFVPEGIVGLLPFRDPKDKKLIFPTGTWRGVYTGIELRAAIRYGAQIRRIHRALHYPESEKYFSEFAQMTLEGRRQCKRDGDEAMEQLYKNYGNGLYGKFGQRNGGDKRYVRLEQYVGELEGLVIVHDADNNPWVQLSSEDAKDAVHSFPVVSATITSYGRVKILDVLMANESSVVYCDTDSIKVIDKVQGISISDKPGDWDYEYTAEQWFFGPKMYGDKRKGVPYKSKLIHSDEDHEIYEFERPTTFKESLRRGIPQNTWEIRRKHVNLIDTKRQWFPDGTSIPLKVIDGEILNPLSMPQSRLYHTILQTYQPEVLQPDGPYTGHVDINR
ncbi:MAG TPA: DNA polymerase [Fervidobacterium sp.]|nr:DNA polymerase [Fervidobacterium sp.]